MTEEKILRWTKEGRGTGTGAGYKPWLTVHDVPSKGLRVRVWGHKTNRVHHLLSFAEYRNYTSIINQPGVIDVQEQKPRPLDLTLSIAKRLGYKHPTAPRTGCLVVMTTDLVSIWKSGPHRILAQHVKAKEEASKKRNQEKAEIEEESWRASPETKFQIVGADDIPNEFVGNMRWLKAAFRPHYLYGIRREVEGVEATLRPLVESHAGPLWELAAFCDKTRQLESGTSLAIVKWLLAHQWWETDLNRTLSTYESLAVRRFAYVHE